MRSIKNNVKVAGLRPPLLTATEVRGRMPRIRCAVCCKPVGEVRVFEDDVERMRYIRVRCHGASDEMQIDLRKLSRSDIEQMNHGEGVAFAHKRIGGASDE